MLRAAQGIHYYYNHTLGTQLAAIKSVFDNKDALRAFARDPVILNGMKQVIVKEEEQVTQSSLA